MTITPLPLPLFLEPVTNPRTLIYPELWERVDSFEKEQKAKADHLPKGEVGPAKTKINAYAQELRADIESMIDSGYGFAEIAREINRKISNFEASTQRLETHNAEFARDAQKVQTKNLSLGDVLRKLQPDLTPLQPKPRTQTPANQPTPSQASVQIAKIEQEWLQKAEFLPKGERAPYCAQVKQYTSNLNNLVSEDDDPRLTKQIIEHNTKFYDDALERNYQHNSHYYWQNVESDPVF